MLQLSVMIWPSCALTMAFSSTAFTGQMKLCTLPFICASKSALKSSTDVVCVGSKGLPSPAPEARVHLVKETRAPRSRGNGAYN